MKVAHFHRKRRPNANYSIEGFYANIRNELKNKAEWRDDYILREIIEEYRTAQD